MKRIYLALLTLLMLGNTNFAQSVYVDNAFNFSKNEYGGTARFVGMGGAFGGLGGDFSSIAINPAGLGVYRSSELVFSPGMAYSSNEASYIGNSVNESDYSVNMNN
ncbi:MAG: hydrocarbon degradation protein, partial [Marinilabiliales bacterium]